MQRLIALLRVFRRGEAVADPALWKSGQIAVTALAALLLALLQAARAFGVAVSADDNQVTAVAAGGIALVNILLTVATSKTVGLPPVDPPAPGAGADAGGADLY